MSVLDVWKRAAAERIQAANAEQVFAGPPPMPLHAIVVVQFSVMPDGLLLAAKLIRVPDHATELGPVALRSLEAAAPLPPLPPGLSSHGPLQVMETWLFRDDGRFQIRSLAQEQQEA